MEALLITSVLVSFVFGYTYLGNGQSSIVKIVLGFAGVLLTPFVIGSLPVMLPAIIKEFRQEIEANNAVLA